MRRKATWWLAAGLVAFLAGRTQAAEIEAIIRLIDQAEVPAREPGVLVRLAAKEGQMVARGDVLAAIEDVETRLDCRRAEIEVRLAAEQAESDVAVRAAEKAAQLAHNEWRRGQNVVKSNPNAISEAELEHRRLPAEKADLDVERAKRDLRVAKLHLALKENELQFAKEKLQRHKVVAPLDGMVVEVHKRLGEWLEPGEQVMRIVRTDRLRAEGFADAAEASGEWVGAPVAVNVLFGENRIERFTGTVVFVSPEIDPVNGQVAVWAEVENRNLLLRPGLHATMTIGKAGSDRP